jgi:mannose-1-phosphate guanylyltransferase
MTNASAESPVAVIMAGGTGERFWPYSRRNRPKQLLCLTGPDPMLTTTVRRIAPHFSPERILIVTGESLREPILRCLGAELPGENIVVEPMARNTAGCLALAAAVVRRRFGNPPIAVLTADHWISPDETFCAQVVQACGLAAQTQTLVTFGIPAARPDVGYGYIEIGGAREDLGPGVHEVHQFREKPDVRQAEEFVRSGRFFWNSGMFFWTCDTIREAFRIHQPAMFEGIEALESAWNTPYWTQTLAAVFQKMPSLPIDVAILEKAANRLVIRAEFTWDDIGTWASLERLHPADAQGNLVLAEGFPLESEGNLLVQVPGEESPAIATYGVKDLVIVATRDVVLVCDRHRAQDLKKLVKHLQEQGQNQLL